MQELRQWGMEVNVVGLLNKGKVSMILALQVLGQMVSPPEIMIRIH